jgi:hypothetical protein
LGALDGESVPLTLFTGPLQTLPELLPLGNEGPNRRVALEGGAAPGPEGAGVGLEVAEALVSSPVGTPGLPGFALQGLGDGAGGP